MKIFNSKKSTQLHHVAPDRLLIDDQTNFNIKEAYKAARTNIMFSIHGEGCKKIVITSSYPAEGKTTATTNLGVTFAQTGARVLVIDCDMRKPKVHQAFHVDTPLGLSNVLGGFARLDEVVVKTKYANLDIIPAGHIPPNPAELLASQAMCDILSKLEQSYDYIFLDTPPVNIVTDATILAPITSGTVLIVRQSVTNHRDVQEALGRLEFVHAKVLGFILGSIKPKNGLGSKYGKYGKGYSKYQDYYA